jgi:CHAT domain-containing protein
VSAIALLLLVAFPALAAPEEQLVARVVDLFVHDDLARLDAAVTGEQDLRPRLDELECISVRHATSEVIARSEDALTLRIDVDATGTTTAAWQPEVRLPRTWYVDAKRTADQWQIVRLVSAERRLVNAMLAAPTAADAECLFANATDASPAATVKEYAELSDAASRFDRLTHPRELAGTLDDPSTMTFALRREATLLSRRRDPAARDLARRALELARQTGSADDVADATFTLAVTEMMTGRTADAMATFGEVADMIEGLDYPIRAMKSLHMHGWLAGRFGMLMELLRTGERLRALARRYRWPEGEIAALSDLATVHGTMGNMDLYGSYCNEAREVAVRVGDRANLARFDYNRADLARAERQYGQALAIYAPVLESAETLLTGEQAIVYVGYAQTLLELGRYDEAEQALARAESLDTGSWVKLARALFELKRGRPDAVIDAARDAIEAARAEQIESTSMEVVAEAFALIGRALRENGKPEAAIEAFRSSLSADEQTETSVNVPLHPTSIDRMPAYFDLIELLVARNDVAEAFRVAEKMRARSLRGTIERGQVDLSATMSDEERTSEAALASRLALANRARLASLSRSQHRPELDQELETARVELDRFREEMRVAHPALARRRPSYDGAVELPKGPETLAVVEFVVARTQTIAFVLTSDRTGATNIAAVPIAVSAAELDRRANELSTLIGARSLGYRTASRKMYDLVVAPIEKQLRGQRMLCVIPDGPLWSVPFHALVTPDGDFVLDRHAVFYASSLALLRAAMDRQPRTKPSLIAFGNPSVGGVARATVRSVFRSASLGPLADAETEALAVSRMYGSGSRAYVRDGAREDVFKTEAAEYGIVHIAAHAIVDPDAPMYSAIVLAARGDDVLEDGLLEGREVVDLPLKAELAVLSACDTARGKAGYGDGVIGLGWAFQAAGCPTLVVSQWQAESRATSEVMIEFHHRLRAGASIADALRGAQLSIRRRYRHPFYWAPFVAVGAAAKPVAAAAR